MTSFLPKSWTSGWGATGTPAATEAQGAPVATLPPLACHTVSDLYIYPIKSCRGFAVTKARLSTTGLLYDRFWMVVYAESGRMLTQRVKPEMATIQPLLPVAATSGEELADDATMEIMAPGMPNLKVPLKLPEKASSISIKFWSMWQGVANDEGDEAAAWFSRVLDLDLRLVRFDSKSTRRQVDRAPKGHLTGFQNLSQFHMIAKATHADLNKKMPAPLPMSRFRPSIVLEGPEAWEEDTWRELRISSASRDAAESPNFVFVKECSRCKVPTVDQETGLGLGSEEPTKTLATFRTGEALGLLQHESRQVYLGAYFTSANCNEAARKPTYIEIGDKLEVLAVRAT
eukprot:SM000070S21304  [mRNA]  locus=s70:160585:162950:- [translate_table: standard]